MAEAIAERVRRYILDGSDEDLRRLLGVAETTREMARSAFRRVGMQEGWHVIDCGCGPIGGLAVMAEMVGPAGRVVGVDFSEPAIQRARSVVAARVSRTEPVSPQPCIQRSPASSGGAAACWLARGWLAGTSNRMWSSTSGI